MLAYPERFLFLADDIIKTEMAEATCGDFRDRVMKALLKSVVLTRYNNKT